MHPWPRDFLHLNKLDAFCQWSKRQGYEVERPKGRYEKLRLRKGTMPPLIYYFHYDGDHVSFNRKEAHQLAKRFVYRCQEAMKA